MIAWASDAAAAGHHGAFYEDPVFWVLVAFVIFILLVGRTAYRLAGIALDQRAERIKAQLDEAQALVKEAQALLAANEQKQRDAAREAEEIVDHARREAERIADRAAEDLDRSLKRREELAFERIEQARQAVVADIKSQAVDVAMEAVRRLLSEEVTGDRASRLVDEAIAELPSRLH